jgi:hypothetical protein
MFISKYVLYYISFVVVVSLVVDYFHAEKLYTFAKEVKNMKLFIYGRFVSLNTGNAIILAFVTARDSRWSCRSLVWTLFFYQKTALQILHKTIYVCSKNYVRYI